MFVLHVGTKRATILKQNDVRASTTSAAHRIAHETNVAPIALQPQRFKSRWFAQNSTTDAFGVNDWSA